MFQQFEPYLLAFLIGLLIGIDRERSLPPGMKGLGVRTFILISMLGSIAAAIAEVNITLIITVFVLSAILLNYYTVRAKLKSSTIGLTSGLAAGAVYCLGYLTHTQPAISAGVGGAILIILLGRKWLHEFAKEKLQPNEVRAAATMVIIVLCVLVFLPNYTIDPWSLFNPQRFGMLVAIIAAMQFTGYVAIRVFGNQLGVMLMGFFGGLVSSTAVFATLPRFVKNHPDRVRSAAAAGLLATVGMLIELMILIIAAAPQLLLTIVPPIAAMLAVGILSALILYKNDKPDKELSTPKNPLDFKSITYISLMIGGMIIIVAAAKQFVGTEGVQIISFLGGLFELHGVSLATATLYTSGKLLLSDARAALLLALAASFVTKFILLWSIARNQFAVITSTFLLFMMAAGAAAALIHVV